MALGFNVISWQSDIAVYRAACSPPLSDYATIRRVCTAGTQRVE